MAWDQLHQPEQRLDAARPYTRDSGLVYFLLSRRLGTNAMENAGEAATEIGSVLAGS